MKQTFETIQEYNRGQKKDDKALCDLLKKEIDRSLSKSESKIWHGAPVWFLDGNPIVGYHILKDRVRLLFWSGQSFEEPGLTRRGVPNDPELPLLFDKVRPLHELVKVDYFIPGCPPPAEAFWSFLTDLLDGREPRLPPGAIRYD